MPNMTDDPRKVLAEAGVECAEVDSAYDGMPDGLRSPGVWLMCRTETAHAAILALCNIIKNLSEFCYECKHLDGWAWCREMSLDEQREHDKRGERDHCHFTPSRWQKRTP